MGYTVEEIRDLENPYQDLGNGDALAQHRDELNKLTPEEQMNLASRMVLGCPSTELRGFRHVIEAAINLSAKDENQTFYSVLSDAYEVKSRIFALLDSRNPNPHRLLLDRELNKKMFNNFNQLAMDVLNNNEAAIAERLAITTPQDARNQLALNVNEIFPDSPFASKLDHAFAIRNDIDSLLLSDHPEQFFISPEFSIDRCIEFKGLFRTLTEQDASSIAQKLALSTPKEQRNKVSLHCQQLNAANDTFSGKVRDAFVLRRDIDDLLLRDHPEQFFTSRDFSVDLCLEFSGLFTLLKGQEQAIGAKLSLLDKNTRIDINRKLEMINGSAHDQTNSFRLIASAMSSKEEAVQKTNTTPQEPLVEQTPNSTNPHALFNQRRQEVRPAALDEVDSDEEEKEKSCVQRFCGFLS